MSKFMASSVLHFTNTAGIRAFLARPLLVCLVCLVAGASACASTPAGSAAGTAAPQIQPQPSAPPVTQAPVPAAAMALETPPPCWLPLIQRLRNDGLDGPDLQACFIRLGDSPSQTPMGTKITELFKSKFLKPPPTPPPPPGTAVTKPVKPRIYPNIVTPANLERCRDFLRANTVAFTMAAQLYEVPKEFVVSLLFVETRLGTYLGKDNAFMSLASMAASTTPEHIPDALAPLPMTPERLEWVKERLQQRSDWAYKELKALIIHTRANKLDPLSMPGSIYGAIGLCQFMPSNFKPYAVDGNGDGKVDLFDPADAIMSVGNYLHAHGWKKSSDRAARHAVLMRYNKSTVYANTILALAEALDPPPAGQKPAAKKAASPKVKKGQAPAKSKATPAPKSNKAKTSVQKTGSTATSRTATAR